MMYEIHHKRDGRNHRKMRRLPSIPFTRPRRPQQGGLYRALVRIARPTGKRDFLSKMILQHVRERDATLMSPRWKVQVRAFFPAHRIELGGKTLEQYLEQLRAAVNFRERESPALAAHLAPR
jgi:hypothetical protein